MVSEPVPGHGPTVATSAITVLSRVQWSKTGITFYDTAGGFVCRLEQPWEVQFVNGCMVDMLKAVSNIHAQMMNRARSQGTEPVQQPVPDTDAVPDNEPGSGSAVQGVEPVDVPGSEPVIVTNGEVDDPASDTVTDIFSPV